MGKQSAKRIRLDAVFSKWGSEAKSGVYDKGLIQLGHLHSLPTIGLTSKLEYRIDGRSGSRKLPSVHPNGASGTANHLLYLIYCCV